MGLFLVGFVLQSFAQDVLFDVKLKKEEVPNVIIESVEEDFPDFIVEEYRPVPLEFIGEDVIVNRNINSNDDYDTYQITFKGKGERLVATYNKDGKLLSTVENGKNIAPPISVDNAVEKAYPEWIITKDNYKIVHYTGSKKIERYKLVLENSGKKIRVYTDASGNILNFMKRN